MIKTSGYRVSPTEVEEVVYDTGLVGGAVALGVDDPLLGQSIVLVVSPANGNELTSEALLARLRRELPQYMVPKQVIVRAALPALSQRQVRPEPAPDRAGGGMTLSGVTTERGTGCQRVGGIALDRLAERVGSTPFFAYDRTLLTEQGVVPPRDASG